jgi:hypothetical protein
MLLMGRNTFSTIFAWIRSKKEDLYAIAIMAGVPLFLIVAAPYCC